LNRIIVHDRLVIIILKLNVESAAGLKKIKIVSKVFLSIDLTTYRFQ